MAPCNWLLSPLKHVDGFLDTSPMSNDVSQSFNDTKTPNGTLPASAKVILQSLKNGTDSP